MTPSKPSQQEFDERENLTINDFAELAQNGAIFSQIEKLWEELLDSPIEDTIHSPEFRKQGINQLIKQVELEASDRKEKTDLLNRLIFLKNNSEKLIKILDPSKKHIEKIRHSGHFIDQKLKYEYPKQNQLNLFEQIESKHLKTKIEKYEFEVKSVGVRLTPPEDKLLNTLQKLLHQKSQNYEPDNGDYYKGNMPVDLVPFGKEKKESPRLRIKPGELYRAYMDRSHYSGDEVKFVRETLMNLSAKKFLLKFDRKRKVEQNGKTQILTDRIEEFQSLIQVIKFTEGMDEKQLKKANAGDESFFDAQGELIIGFNPILVDQINSKYIEYPSDINKKMILAAGGHRYVTEAMNLLRDYMLRELASKRFEIEINKDRLPHLLKLDNYLAARQKKRAEKKVEDAIQTIKNLGLITSVKVIEGSNGQQKYVFSLNSNFQ
ncbi:MAG: hypothetical protein KDK96_09680 [Chlamydiia bacterium]|nr:hypothetical protein [Chlamydiia bacterium]